MIENDQIFQDGRRVKSLGHAAITQRPEEYFSAVFTGQVLTGQFLTGQFLTGRLVSPNKSHFQERSH